MSALLKSAGQGGLPYLATVAAGDAYGNRGRVLTPYSGRPLTSRQDAFNYFISSCRIFIEQVLGVIVARHILVTNGKLGEEGSKNSYRFLQTSQVRHFPKTRRRRQE
jgi:hypothetical protein